MATVFTDDGRIVSKEMPVLLSCMVSESSHQKYLISDENQYLAEDNTWHQELWENDEVPICERVKSNLQDGKDDEGELAKLHHELYAQTVEQAQSELYEKARKSELANKMVLMASIVFGVILIIAFMYKFF